MKAKAISNMYEFYNAVSVQEVKTQTFEDDLLKINKVKHALGILYFIGTSAILVSLFL